MSIDLERSIRMAAFEWLKFQSLIYGNVLSYNLIRNGFEFDGQKIHLVGPTGIWKPVQCKYPISILTSIGGNYQDSINEDNFIVYNYRGDNPEHHNNVGLRRVMQEQLPLIYFLGIARNRYIPVFPIFITKDDPKNLSILLQVDSRIHVIQNEFRDIIDPVRNYLTVEVKRRIHQDRFRENILHAYKCQCAFCNIRHVPLLDAAHITPDRHFSGDPIVSNGISLCKIHHAAFDANLMGITPDYKIEVKEKLLEEIDGPMLQHGIKELNRTRIFLPSRKEWRPDPDRIAIRYNEFRKTG